MIINTHSHIFPDQIVERVINYISKKGNMKPYGQASLSGLLNNMEYAGIDYSVTLPIATEPRQQTSINNFAANLNNDKIIPFGTVNPYATDFADELVRLQNLGLRGIKLHPEYQGFDIDDKKIAYPVYEAAASLNIPIVFHAGFDVAFPSTYHAAPQRIANVLKDFGNNTFILAHMGGMTNTLSLADSLEYIAGKNCFIDTSLASVFINTDLSMELINKHGTEKILFGTDFPWSDSKKEIEFIDSLPLSEADKDKIFYKNAAELFNIGER